MAKLSRENFMLILILFGVVIGFIIGCTLNEPIGRLEDEKKEQAVMLISFLGEIFIRLLKLLIVPLIVTSIILAVASLDTKTTGKIGRRTVIYYLITSFLAVIIGIVLVVSIRPGERAEQQKKGPSKHLDALDSILDLIRNLFPDNIVETTFRTVTTSYEKKATSYESSNETVKVVRDSAKNLANFVEKTIYDPWSVDNSSSVVRTVIKNTKPVRIGLEKIDRVNVLGLVVCSLAFGIALSKLGDEGQQMLRLFQTMMKIIMSLVNVVMWMSPVGICSLIAGKLVEMDNIGKTFESLAYLILTAIIGISIQTLVIYPLIYYLMMRKNPYRYMFGLRSAMVVAFGTDSSAATLPVTIRCVTDINKVDSRIASFVLPIGATVNMDGTALYEAVCCIYIAQLNGYDFGFGKIVITSLTAVAASIGAAAVPSAGLVLLLMVLEAVGLPTGDVGLLYAVDWFVDRFRTMCNVMGDAFGAAVVERLSRHELETDNKEFELKEKNRNDTLGYSPQDSVKDLSTSRDANENGENLLAEI